MGSREVVMRKFMVCFKDGRRERFEAEGMQADERKVELLRSAGKGAVAVVILPLDAIEYVALDESIFGPR